MTAILMVGGMKMIQSVQKKNMLALFLAVAFVLLSIAPSSFAYGHYRRYRVYHHHSVKKGALIGGAGGPGVGARAGGGKGELMGGAIGAGAGYLVQRYRNHHHRHHR